APPHPRAVRRRAAEPDQDLVAADPAAAVGVRLLRRLRGPPGRPAHPGRPGGGPRALHVPEGPGIVSRGGVSGRTMPTTWERLANDSILDLRPYEPGKPTGEVERELGVAGAVKLASNENPFPPTAAVREALQAALDGLNRYPDGSARALRQALAKKHDVPADGIVVGNGSNELIELVARTFVRAGEEVVLPHPSFIVYPSIVQSVGGIRVVVPLREHRLDLAAMARAITPLTKLVFVANPNNPTGTIVTAVEVDDFLRHVPERVIVVFDEAYYDFAAGPDFPDTVAHLRQGRRVVVLRTFSKMAGLAGLRVGYALADPECAALVNRIRQPFNVNTLAQVAAAA